jgi:hypothetical protein
MSELNLNETKEMNTTEPTNAASSKPAVDLNDTDVNSLVQQMVAEELKGIKDKLNSAYTSRDEAVRAKTLLEEEKKQADIKRMEEEGKHKEVAELRMAEMQAKLEALQSQNTGLTRDNAVKGALAGIEFRNDVAADMAYDRVVSQMTQDANGQWVHKSGVSISEFVQMFSKDEANSFLMKAKVNTGTGSAAMAAGAPDTSSSKSITEMNTNELLEHFAKQAPNGNFGF